MYINQLMNKIDDVEKSGFVLACCVMLKLDMIHMSEKETVLKFLWKKIAPEMGIPYLFELRHPVPRPNF